MDGNTPNQGNILANNLGEVQNTTLPEIAEKEENIKKRQKKFKLVLYIIGGIVATVILLALVLSIVKYIQNKNKKSFEAVETPIVTTTLDISSNWVKYDSPEIKIQIKYPDNAKLIENKGYEGRIRNVEIIYTPNDTDGVNGNNLTEGFIFRITPLQITKDNLDDIATVKRESFSIECGSGVEMSSVRPDLVYGIDARTFDVRNCMGDFKVTYVKRFGIYYEITQLYRGDLGFRQQYKNTPEEMVKSLVFYPEEKIIESPFKEYASAQYDFKFTYPKEFSADCCTVPEIKKTGVRNIVTLGVKGSNEKYGAFGIFTEDNSTKKTFDQYVQEQKETLISDYKIVNNGK